MHLPFPLKMAQKCYPAHKQRIKDSKRDQERNYYRWGLGTHGGSVLRLPTDTKSQVKGNLWFMAPSAL